jgi:thermitase
MILDILYPVSFVTSLTGLILWHFFEGNKKMTKLMSFMFVAGYFIYVISLAFSSGSFSYKLLILFRDMVVLGLVTQLFSLFRRNLIAFVGLLVILYGVIGLTYFRILQNTFPQMHLDALSGEEEFLVELHPGDDPANLEKLLSKYKLSIQPAFQPADKEYTDLDDYYIINIPKKYERKYRSIAQVLERHASVEWIESNEVVQVNPIESEAPVSTRKEFFFNDPGISMQWGFEPMHVDDLNRYLMESGIKPGKKALLAILDTGVDAQHEDIAVNFTSIKETYNNDPQGHGTHVAGIAAAASNNGLGIASYAPEGQYVTVTSIKVLNSYGMGTQRSIINGIIEAADAGADVISLSLGGRSDEKKQKAYSEAVSYANRLGAIVVVAAGNEGKNAKNTAPANVQGVITVSAVDDQNKKAVFSNSVEDLKMGVAAPGVNIYSTIPQNKYIQYNGTSMATPYVSGLVALMKSIQPDLKTSEVYKILSETGTDTDNRRKTGPFIQPFEAFKAVVD